MGSKPCSLTSALLVVAMGSGSSKEESAAASRFGPIEGHGNRELARKTLSKCPFFKHLSTVARDMLVHAFRMRTFNEVCRRRRKLAFFVARGSHVQCTCVCPRFPPAQGEIVLEEGETSKDLYIVASGSVQVVTIRDSVGPSAAERPAAGSGSKSSGAALPPATVRRHRAITVEDGSATARAVSLVQRRTSKGVLTSMPLAQGALAEEGSRQQGTVNLFKERVLATESAGSYFGEVAFTDGQGSVRTARVRAASPRVAILQLPYETYKTYTAPQHFLRMEKMLADITHRTLSEKLRLGTL